MTSAQLKIKRVSVYFRWLFLSLLFIVPLVHIVGWLNAPIDIDVTGRFGFLVSVVPKGIEILHPLSPATRFYGFLIDAIPKIAVEFMLFYLVRLFYLYESAVIFSIQNVNYIKKIGYALLAMQVSSVICSGLLSALLTWSNPSGHRRMVVTLSGTDVTVIVVAFIFILISWIMAEGCRLREEEQLTI